MRVTLRLAGVERQTNVRTGDFPHALRVVREMRGRTSDIRWVAHQLTIFGSGSNPMAKTVFGLYDAGGRLLTTSKETPAATNGGASGVSIELQENSKYFIRVYSPDGVSTGGYSFRAQGDYGSGAEEQPAGSFNPTGG